MDKEEAFSIEGLGQFRFKAELASVDYPLIFVCERLSDGATFLFYQNGSDDVSVTWLAVQIKQDSLGSLIEDCRFSKAWLDYLKGSGYIVKSEAGKEEASCEAMLDIASLLED